MANAANHVILSTGQILFADPTLPWVPANFPNLPSTALVITGAGTIAGRNISKLSFSNAISYENFQSPPLRPSLVKSLVINSAGDVGYDDPKVSLVSTSLTAYPFSITGFGSSNIGAPGIESSPADTLTNAIAKLDGWVTECLLKQPPAVSLAEIENTSLYSGIRWNNYNVYNVFQYSVPYTTGIVLVLGDPSTVNYLTLELTNTDWFPDRQYSDGLASDFNPLVRLRIFNKFFPTNTDEVYSKAALPAGCVKIIGEGGIYSLPSSGKVLGVENSVAGETYTTMNLYLPQIPVGQIIPINLIYINKTQSPTNVMTSYTSTTSFGAPSAPSSFVQTLSTPTSFTLRVGPPVYSDETHGVSTCYLSSYNIQYTASRMNTAHSGNLGFRYGEVLPSILPPYLSSYAGSTLTRITPVQGGGFQDVLVIGEGGAAVLPGIQWSTSIYATNLAHLIGSTLGGPTVVSAFPNNVAQNISSASVQFTSPWAVPPGPGGLAYIGYNNGWNLRDPVSTGVLFLASTQLTTFRLNAPVQFNDVSYPGCLSNFIVTSEFKDIDGVAQTQSLAFAPFSNDFVLNVPSGVKTNANYLSTILTDSQISTPSQKFFYNANITGGRAVSTISGVPQSLTVALKNFAVTGFNDPIVTNFLSTQQDFLTEPANNFNTSGLNYANIITSTVQICGLYTPVPGSKFLFDLYTSNSVRNFANFSSFAQAQLYFDSQPAGPLTKYTSSIRFFNGAAEVTSLPFPENTALTISSCAVALTEDVYMDPADPREIEIYASATPANPNATQPMNPFSLGSNIFIDTNSAQSFSTFTNVDSSVGQRLLSLLPRLETPGTQYNMNDGIDSNGQASNGLDVSVSSFLIINYSNDLFISSFVYYNNTSSLSAIYTDPYSRELLYTNGAFTHPGGLNFSQFSGTSLGQPSAVYPDFTSDLANDVNYGNRYASFLYLTESNAAPTGKQFLNICVKNPSALSTITNSRAYNYAFPDQPIPDYNVEFSKVRMHVKVIGAYNRGIFIPLETAWLNCLKEINYGDFDDSVFDVGACVGVSTSGADVWYKVQMKRRFFTSIYPLVRVGISRDASAEELPAGSAYLPITFDAINVTVTDS